MAREPIGILLYSGIDVLIPKLPQAMSRQVIAHGHIIEAIRNRDSVTAREWMTRHVDDFKRGYIRAGIPLDKPISGASARLAEVTKGQS